MVHDETAMSYNTRIQSINTYKRYILTVFRVGTAMMYVIYYSHKPSRRRGKVINISEHVKPDFWFPRRQFPPQPFAPPIRLLFSFLNIPQSSHTQTTVHKPNGRASERSPRAPPLEFPQHHCLFFFSWNKRERGLNDQSGYTFEMGKHLETVHASLFFCVVSPSVSRRQSRPSPEATSGRVYIYIYIVSIYTDK